MTAVTLQACIEEQLESALEEMSASHFLRQLDAHEYTPTFVESLCALAKVDGDSEAQRAACNAGVDKSACVALTHHDKPGRSSHVYDFFVSNGLYVTDYTPDDGVWQGSPVWVPNSVFATYALRLWAFLDVENNRGRHKSRLFGDALGV